MPSYSKSRGGLFAKRVGSEFENRLFHFLNGSENTSCIRIPDGCKQISFTKIIRVKTPFDFLIGYKNEIIFCDTKTTKENIYPLMDKIEHQLYNFELLSKHNKKTGYLIEFREAFEFRWYSLKMIRETLLTRKSLTRESGVLLGSTFPTEINLDKILETP